MEKNRKLAAFFGIVLSVISAVFTCQLLLKFATTGLTKMVFVIMGITIQAVQTLTITLCVYCVFQGKIARAVPSGCIYMLLLILSFAGTMGSLSSENKEINDLTKQNSPEYRMFQEQLTDLDTQIAFVKKTIEDCASRSIISRCVTPKTEELNGLLAEKKAVHERMMNLKPQYSGDELFRRIGKFLGIESDQAKSMIYLLYALAIDLGAACLLAYSAGLLAFKERDIWAVAQAESEAERRRTALKKEKLLSEIPDTGQTQIRQKMSVSVPAGQTDTHRKRQTQDRQHRTGQDTDTGVIKNRIGYLTDRTQEKTDRLKRYIAALFNGQKPDGSLIGRRKIGDLLKFSQQECDQIHAKLKSQGLIRVKGQKTYPEMGREEMIDRINGGIQV